MDLDPNALCAREGDEEDPAHLLVSSGPAIASPQVEAAVKAENAVTFTAASERVRTLATWIPATRQVLDNFNELRGYIDDALMYAVNKAQEVELLSVDATGEHLHALIPQATASSGTQRA